MLAPEGENLMKTANSRTSIRCAAGLTTATALALALMLSSAPGVGAEQDSRGRACSENTLRGDYGLVSTGTRGLGPGASESFVTLSLVTYDGPGTITATGVSHGTTTGVRSLPVTGTYFVNADCTGGETTIIPGLPPLEDSFVLVDEGREVRTVVVSPATTVATANLRRK